MALLVFHRISVLNRNALLATLFLQWQKVNALTDLKTNYLICRELLFSVPVTQQSKPSRETYLLTSLEELLIFL